MMETSKGLLRAAPERMRAGLGAGAEDIVVSALVAAPFAGTFGIWLSWLTWAPNPVIWVATAIVIVALGLWIAGRGVSVAEAHG